MQHRRKETVERMLRVRNGFVDGRVIRPELIKTFLFLNFEQKKRSFFDQNRKRGTFYVSAGGDAGLEREGVWVFVALAAPLLFIDYAAAS